ncbi:hypothetical protein DCO48_07530 [Pseudomonas sp. SDI]|uniref:hypothetical protein n=1 Tax=Pseudomonas sp. SDI TaxID=2170734 RepID=UPI000DE7AA3E|nr:hypothetical protein [Pseudomonas sp. SDI]PWB34141.1 hypothetical protein DCO48_07530 [Pseudomonas sp. SDI]
MNIFIEQHLRQGRWWIHLDAWEVSFRSLDEATAFVDRLNARLNAPHSLTMLAHAPLRPSSNNAQRALPGSPRDLAEVRHASLERRP